MTEDDLRRNQLREIEGCIARLAEPIEAIVLGAREKPNDHAPLHTVLSWPEARQWFDIDYLKTYGSEYDVRPFYAYTKSWVIFMGHYDGSTFLVSLPRHPNGKLPVEFGGLDAEPPDRWIECECPTGHDFDVFPGEPNFGGPDKIIQCSACGGEHRLGDVGQMHAKAYGKTVTLNEEQWRAAAAEMGNT